MYFTSEPSLKMRKWGIDDNEDKLDSPLFRTYMIRILFRAVHDVTLNVGGAGSA